ncbi:hypothetical protein GCM10007231_05170 [Nocardioides daphniae]|uniref:ABC transporter permease n=1 Tax=Nocardioides daphniae TaxID=402297 RepID=A0ABQ1Q1N3_9ACTN|nr:hypothetical protein GCM10007231_05170 [Nocardioides daphniae]
MGRTYAVSASPWSLAEIRRAVADTGHLLRFRSGTVRRPAVIRTIWMVVVALTAAAVLGPLLAPGAGADEGLALNTLIILPTFMIGFLGLTVAAAVASGGGRELLSGEDAVAFPVSPTTDHLGALLMAPLNIGWILQAWFLLGATTFAHGLDALPWLLTIVVLWLVLATALGQVIAWSVESVRRRRHGVAIVRTAGVAVAVLLAWLQLSGHLNDVLDQVPTLELVVAGLQGFSVAWVVAVTSLLALTAVALVLGGVACHSAARRQTRDALKVETQHFAAQPTPRTLWGMLVRIDRASVWRAVPMRRGMLVLAVGPGLIAFAGGLTWENVIILPGLVASGGALLYGVNAFALDGRGGLWRETLPVDPQRVWTARSWVMAEWLLAASVITVVLAALRAGVPTASEVAAVLCLLLVVTVQVVSTSMRWSVTRPFAVNLRSARATPAPPTVMVGYSAKLALSTTLTAMVFSTASWAAPWHVVVLLAVPFLAWSAFRWWRAGLVWTDASSRAAVVTTVAA